MGMDNLIKREQYIDELVSMKDKSIIKIITGVRRCGKSTLLFSLYRDVLLEKGVKEDHIITVPLDGIKNKELRDPSALYDYIRMNITDENRYYVMIDEVQLVKDFEEAVIGIKNDFNTDVYITGSNSEFLSKDVNTKFRGRGIEIHMLPLSFSEYYSYVGGDKKDAFNDYVLYGGMPYNVQITDKRSKTKYLDMLLNTVELRDVIDRYGIKNVQAFKAVTETLYSTIGSKISAKRISDTLTAAGKSIDHKTVSNYIEYLCDSFLFYKADRYDLKGRAYLRTQPKYYPCDIGLRNTALAYRQNEMTHIIETIVFLELKNRGYTVDVGVNVDKEIDFVVRNIDEIYYIQVTMTLNEEKVREREFGSFKNLDDGFMKFVITMDEDPFTITENGYRKLNLLDFLLDKKSLENN